MCFFFKKKMADAGAAYCATCDKKVPTENDAFCVYCGSKINNVECNLTNEQEAPLNLLDFQNLKSDERTSRFETSRSTSARSGGGGATTTTTSGGTGNDNKIKRKISAAETPGRKMNLSISKKRTVADTSKVMPGKNLV